MKRGLLACLPALALALVAGPARADTSSAPRSRFYAGNALWLFGKASLSVEGKAQPSEGGALDFGFTGAYLQRLLPHLGLELFASWGPTETGWSESRQETRQRSDLALGPVYCTELGKRAPHTEWRLGLPIGYSWVWFRPGRGRAVEETYRDGRGLNVALITGFDFFGEHHGGYVEGGYSLHMTWVTHTSTLKADPRIHSSESYRYIRHSMQLGAGYAYRF